MPYEFDLVKPPGCAVVTWTGKVTVEEVVDYYEVLAVHPKPYGGLPKLYDLRGATIDLGGEELLDLAQRVRKIDELHGGGARKVAMLVASDAEFEAFRRFANAGEESRIDADYCVTKDVAEAKAWAGLPPDYVLPADR